MIKFRDWFNQKLVVGAFPIKQNTLFNPDDYDIVINVSDEWYPDIEMQLRERFIQTFWFPMNECKYDIGLNSIYAAMVILNRAEQRNLSVYLHCHAGVNRSQIIRSAYYFMRTGKQLEEDCGNFINMMVAACNRGYLPPKVEMESFLNQIAINKNNMQGGILDIYKLKSIS